MVRIESLNKAYTLRHLWRFFMSAKNHHYGEVYGGSLRVRRSFVRSFNPVHLATLLIESNKVAELKTKEHIMPTDYKNPKLKLVKPPRTLPDWKLRDNVKQLARIGEWLADESPADHCLKNSMSALFSSIELTMKVLDDQSPEVT